MRRDVAKHGEGLVKDLTPADRQELESLIVTEMKDDPHWKQGDQWS